MIKYFYLETRSRNIFSGEVLELFPLNSERSKDYHISNIVQEGLIA